MGKEQFPEYAKDGETFKMEITQQKLAHRESDGKLCLMLIWRDPESRESFRLEDAGEIHKVVKQIVKHNIINNPDPEQKKFFRELAVAVMKGYNLSEDLLISTKKEEKAKHSLADVKLKQRGRGI